MADNRQGDDVIRLRSQVPSGIKVLSSNLRSVNLVRDSGASELCPLYPNTRVLDVLSRFAAAMDDFGRNRAWSITGPYGSGKSTIALFATTLLGPENYRRRKAEEILAEGNSNLARRIAAARDHIAPEGFITAIAAARREPLVKTLQRALTRGVHGRWPDGKSPNRIKASLRALRDPSAGSAESLAALEVMCEIAPVLLVIDEFGKNLEHIASARGTGGVSDDVYVLQEIAEAGAGRSGLPLFTLTLKHLTFLDYAVSSTTLQGREWAKVQGRFEDITFAPDSDDAVQLITRSIDQEELTEFDREYVRRHGDSCAAAWERLGLQGVLAADRDLFAALYPLHPLTAAVAPLVAAQIGQNDRSLAGFLAADEPFTVRRFIANFEAAAASTGLTVRLPQLYDYFFASGRTTILASAAASRWIEIDLILSEAHGIDEQDLQILKTIAILNLVDASGALRACTATVLFALTDPLSDHDHDLDRKSLLARIEKLVQQGFLVYREFNDEYRIWRGSAVDLQSRITEARERCDDHAVAKMLAKLLPPAVVAGRHSQLTGMLRHFVTMTTDSSTGTTTGPDVGGPADGVLIFHFGNERDLPVVRSPLPAVVGTSKNAGTVLNAGREVMALEETLSADDLDAAARREVTERAGQARAELAAVLAEAFSPGKPWTRWFLSNPPEGSLDEEEVGDYLQVLSGQSLARIVSDACDTYYHHTPRVRNEMLGRHQLTSQGAKARRAVMTAMLTRASSAFLGIVGYGPERAIYDGVIAYLGLHNPAGATIASTDVEIKYEFTSPREGSPLKPAWEALYESISETTKEVPISDLFRILMAPPYGVKSGVVPIIITAAMIVGRGEIAVFEEGTYQPILTPNLMERLIKAPSRYTVKYAPVTEGQRHLILEKTADVLGIVQSGHPSQSRNPALLVVARELLSHVRGLTAYAAGTKRLSERALDVRNVLMTARDPDELLFTALPHALGLTAIGARAKQDRSQASEFARRLADALSEIRGADEALRAEVVRILAHEFRLPDRIPDMRKALAARAAAFAEAISEPELRGFVSLALNDDLPDDEWLDPVVVRLVRAGLASWTDGHLKQLENSARRLSRALDRLTRLYEPGIDAVQTADGQIQLVSVTSHDGNENRLLVHIPDSLRDAASRLATKVAINADQQLGTDGRRILLAMLAEALAEPNTAELYLAKQTQVLGGNYVPGGGTAA